MTEADRSPGTQLIDLRRDKTFSVRFSTVHNRISVNTDLLGGLGVVNQDLDTALWYTLVGTNSGVPIIHLGIKYSHISSEFSTGLDVRIVKTSPNLNGLSRRVRSFREQFTVLDLDQWRATEARLPWNVFLNGSTSLVKHRVPGVNGEQMLVLPL